MTPINLAESASNPQALHVQFAPLAMPLKMIGTRHDLRQTIASHLAMEGVPIPIIKDLLGHSDIAKTMIYAHLSPEVHAAVIEKLPF
jgi:site-specific recombinase XerD